MTQSLAEQVVLITGASSGIGAALAKELARQHSGICLVLAARNQSLLEAVADCCRQHGAQVLVVPTDLSKVEQVQSLGHRAIEYFQRVDVLVNNAGYGQMGVLELMPHTAAQRQMMVNFHAPLILSQTLIPNMRSHGGGKIINVSSLGS